MFAKSSGEIGSDRSVPETSAPIELDSGVIVRLKMPMVSCIPSGLQSGVQGLRGQGQSAKIAGSALLPQTIMATRSPFSG